MENSSEICNSDGHVRCRKKHSNEMMEDMGYFCIDNLPIQLLDKLIDFSNTFHSDVSKVAVGIDVRNGSGIDEIPQTLEQLRQKISV